MNTFDWKSTEGQSLLEVEQQRWIDYITFLIKDIYDLRPEEIDYIAENTADDLRDRIIQVLRKGMPK